ncbi:MAG TPA: hypothetical protein VGL42_10965 [Opitutaceae bacterium]|jgi:hypothetical protein
MLGAIIYILLSALVAYIGTDRKFGFWGNFACSFLFTPIIGLLIVIASDKRVPAVMTVPVAVASDSAV